MAYKRKTIDCWDIETNCGDGWDAETREYSLGEAKAMAKTYRENSDGRFAVRIIKRREPKDVG